MMFIVMISIFVIGIIAIALEDKIKINKAASALLTALLLWLIYAMSSSNAELVDTQIIKHLGDVSETLFFVMSSMVIIELIDVHGGFLLITNRIHTENKRKLLWIVSFTAFIMSAMLDNLATAIVMVAMLRKLIPHSRERWIYASMIVIAANAGGAWSPIGDVTTILLWTNGNITPVHQILQLILPSFVCMFVSLLIVSRFFKKDDRWDRANMPKMVANPDKPLPIIRIKSRLFMLFIGIMSLAMVPVFNAVTGLPPFMGVLFGLVILWIYTDVMYGNMTNLQPKMKFHVTKVITRIDMPTILFFLGILMAVAALQSAGQLVTISDFLNSNVGDPLSIAFIIGLLSSVLDNVALVAATVGMYPLVDVGSTAQLAQYFVVNGGFWTFLAYCAVTGGSIFIIGSATGVTIMGLEKVPFSYYLKHFSLIALTGYLCGAITYYLLSLI